MWVGAIMVVVISVLLFSSGLVSAGVYMNNPEYTRLNVCEYNHDDVAYGCDREPGGYNGLVTVSSYPELGVVQRVGHGTRDNTWGAVDYWLSSPVGGDFEVSFLYNSLGVRGKAEGRSDSLGVQVGDYLVYFWYSNYVSSAYNGVFSLYNPSNKQYLYKVTGDKNMWNTYFNQNKFYIVRVGRHGAEYYFELLDYPSGVLLERFVLLVSPEYSSLDLRKVYVSVWQGRALIDNVVVSVPGVDLGVVSQSVEVKLS